MSYDIEALLPDGKVAELPFSHEWGGTVAVGGTSRASLNITYNYSRTLNSVLPGGIPGLKGRPVAETAGELVAAISALPLEAPAEDYWAETPGNVRQALVQLLDIALHVPPGCVWVVW